MKPKHHAFSQGIVSFIAYAMVGGWLTLASLPAVSQDSATEPVTSGQELIKVRPSGSRQPGMSLRVQLIPEKKSVYHVNERVRFMVKGNKTFYLYLFNIDPDTGSGIAILPNRLQGKDSLRYSANKWHLVPNPGVEFFSDRPGFERIIMVASERYLNLDTILSNNQTTLNGFYNMQSVTDGLNAGLKPLLQGDGNQDWELMDVRRADSPFPQGLVIQEVNLRIRPLRE